jgi:mono/diheme cytochrome c family protein
MRPSLALLAIVLALALAVRAETAPAPRYGLGTPATPEEIAGWDIDVRADGAGLPPGHGSVSEGQAIYVSTCAGCHGRAGQGGVADALVGGDGTLATAKPVRTVGSYWPYATTLFDYVRRAMPYTAPQSLTADQTYAVVAYVLDLNHIVPDDAVLDARSLPRVRMPNRDGFRSPDPRPDAP